MTIEAGPVLAALPQRLVDVSVPATGAKTVRVMANGDLQAALNSAQPGDVLALEPGATYKGPFLLPAKAGAGWITVRSAASDVDLGTARVGPASSPRMPKLVASSGSVITMGLGAHHFRFIGVEISPSAGSFLHDLVAPAQDPHSESEQPHHIIFDRCYVHGDPARGSRRAIALNGANLAVIHSYLADFKEAGNDSQALAGWNGTGPIKIFDNFIEGAAENLMFGGADSAIRGLVPSDIEIRGNTFSKNLRWDLTDRRYDGSHWTMKTLLELKNARRVLIEANVFENFRGFAVVITPRNQSGGAPWSTVEDVTLRYNWIRQVSSLINISGFDEYHPSRPATRITVEHNVAENLSDKGEPNPKAILINQGPDDVMIRHNTILTQPGLGSSYLCFANATTKKGSAFAFVDNVAHMGTYGLSAENPSLGSSSSTLLNGHFKSWAFAGNVLINTQGAATNLYPSGQRWETSLKSVGFRDPAAHDFRLIPNTRYRGITTDKTDPGADIAAIAAAFNRATSAENPLRSPQ